MNRSAELAANLAQVKSRIVRPGVTLIVVTKTYPLSDVQILRDCGVENFGENRSDEGLVKAEAVKARWHYQGEIQSRKIKEIVQWADCIHSLDDVRHAEKISAAAARPIDVFVQLSLDGDPARGGVILDDVLQLAHTVLQLPQMNLLGMMCVPPVSEEPERSFAKIAQAHQRFIGEIPHASALSAGMSGDYEIAITHGATHIRVGSSILGPRTYR
jgi:pyridoxal phosphate enzyme (YggS family)